MVSKPQTKSAWQPQDNHLPIEIIPTAPPRKTATKQFYNKARTIIKQKQQGTDHHAGPS